MVHVVKELADVDVHHPLLPFLDIFLGCFDRIVRATPWD
jgi:hypothetical protein